MPAGDLPRVNEGLRELQEPGSISREGRTAASAIQELSLKDIADLFAFLESEAKK